MLEGLRVLHSRGVVHRDLKSANILLSAPDLIKIADLGVSTVLHSTELARTQIGTPLYLAPEIWRHRPYDQKCDMWSLGILLYEMMTFSYPFNGGSEDQLFRRICRGRYRRPRGYSGSLLSIMRRLLQLDPDQRPTVEDLLMTESITSRRHLVDQFLSEQGLLARQDELLATIKVPYNLRQVKMPRPSYGKQPNIVKPLEERIHLKNRALAKKPLENLSSPELKRVCERDWWSPVKFDVEDALDEAPQPVMKQFIPAGNAAPIVLPGKPRAGGANPRYKRLLFR
jgi:NIMA (never in mitosis gene a)-related kinase